MIIQHFKLVVLIGCLIRYSCAGRIACPTAVCTCGGQWDEQIDCMNRGLERVPYFQRATHVGKVYDILDIGENSISYIPAFAFLDVRVRHIKLSFNSIYKGISPWAFSGLGNILETLDMRACSIAILHWAVFENLRALRQLDLSKNKLTMLPTGLFDNVPKLKSLILSRNRISRLRYGNFRKMRELTTLILHNNQISTIDPGTFNDLRNLTELDLSFNKLTELTRGMFTGLSGLKKLSLEDNSIALIGLSSLRRVPRLEFLQLSRNNLSDVNEANFRGLSHLKHLFLQNVTLTRFSGEAVSRLHSLKTLHLGQNNIEVMEGGCFLMKLPHMRVMRLGDNPIRCTCQMEWVKEITLHSDVRVEGTCRTPADVRGRKISDYNVYASCDVMCHQ